MCLVKQAQTKLLRRHTHHELLVVLELDAEGLDEVIDGVATEDAVRPRQRHHGLATPEWCAQDRHRVHGAVWQRRVAKGSAGARLGGRHRGLTVRQQLERRCRIGDGECGTLSMCVDAVSPRVVSLHCAAHMRMGGPRYLVILSQLLGRLHDGTLAGPVGLNRGQPFCRCAPSSLTMSETAQFPAATHRRTGVPAARGSRWRAGSLMRLSMTEQRSSIWVR